MSGEEIQRNLVAFAQKWSLYSGSERAEAQTFLNDLFACYGSDRYEVGARFEEAQAGRLLDLIWPRVCLIEMKRPSEASSFASHRPQALGYWREAADPERNLPAPRFVVLCAFQRFEVWEPGAFPQEPRIAFDLVELPDRMDALLFLAGRHPTFVGSQEAVTREDRRAAAGDVLRYFLLQCVWCMFAEDLGQLEEHLFTRLLDDLAANPQRSSADDLWQLFDWLRRSDPQPSGGLYARTPFVNGQLYQEPARVHPEPEELTVLRSGGGHPRARSARRIAVRRGAAEHLQRRRGARERGVM